MNDVVLMCICLLVILSSYYLGYRSGVVSARMEVLRIIDNAAREFLKNKE